MKKLISTILLALFLAVMVLTPVFAGADVNGAATVFSNATIPHGTYMPIIFRGP
jgi:hypothetical protein